MRALQNKIIRVVFLICIVYPLMGFYPNPDPYSTNVYDFRIELSPTSGFFYYCYNGDSTTVSLSFVSWGHNTSKNYVKSVTTVIEPSTGKEYLITALGDGGSWMALDGFTMSSNIRRIEHGALFYSSTYEIDDNVEFDYLGRFALGFKTQPTIRIADHGTMFEQDCLPQKIYLGRGVHLSVQFNLFWRGKKSNDTASLNNVIYSYSQQPPQLEAMSDIAGLPEGETPTIFPSSADSMYRAEYMTVYVPYGCREAYKADPEWGKFENIREMRFDPASGIDDVVADEVLGISVVTEPSALRVSAPCRQTVSVYAITGMLVKRAETDDEGMVAIPIEAGAYIVKVGEGFVRKVVVR